MMQDIVEKPRFKSVLAERHFLLFSIRRGHELTVSIDILNNAAMKIHTAGTAAGDGVVFNHQVVRPARAIVPLKKKTVTAVVFP